MRSSKHTADGRRLGTLLAVCAVMFWAHSARAEPPTLQLPIDCTVGESCWLANLVDRDPGPGRTDFRCGTVSYDTHRGVDFAIRDMAEMARGVSVLAAAAGTVRAIRDGMAASTPQDLEHPNRLAGRECGNGVVIAHEDGWTTQYCHMKAGSLTVTEGQKVDAGTPLGEVGLSGRTEFPHLHMAVRRGKTVYDPFTGQTSVAACDPNAETAGFWASELRDVLRYPGPQPYNLGFHTQAPDLLAARAGQLRETRLAADAPALVFWADTFYVSKGDTVRLTLTGPTGTIVEREAEVDRPLARLFRFVGRKRTASAWPRGTYTGTIRIERDGTVTERSATMIVE